METQKDLNPKIYEDPSIKDSKKPDSNKFSKDAKFILIGVVIVLAFVLINSDSIFNKRNSSPQQQNDNYQQNDKSIFRPGYDYFLGIWTQVADENGNPLPASKTPIKIRITKPNGFFYFVEVSFDNEVKYLSMPGDGIYEKFGFTLRNRKFSNTTLEYKHDSNNPDNDYLYEEGGSGFFKKLEN